MRGKEGRVEGRGRSGRGRRRGGRREKRVRIGEKEGICGRGKGVVKWKLRERGWERDLFSAIYTNIWTLFFSGHSTDYTSIVIHCISFEELTDKCYAGLSHLPNILHCSGHPRSKTTRVGLISIKRWTDIYKTLNCVSCISVQRRNRAVEG